MSYGEATLPGPEQVSRDSAGDERHRFDGDLAWLPEVARGLDYPTPLTATVSPRSPPSTAG
ncbi:hypothetical protein [Micromonospora sp. NPDC049799]|uniref:hypothetical protein n=1 Tax=Micromonospora sp. NPDC049799 TaxID=3154741 RepID=UPI0033D959F6